MAFGGPPDELHQDNRINAAVSLAKKSIEDPHNITDEDFDYLNNLFNCEELSTLCSFTVLSVNIIVLFAFFLYIINFLAFLLYGFFLLAPSSSFLFVQSTKYSGVSSFSHRKALLQ